MRRRIAALHVGKYFPPFAGGIENFLADLLGALVRVDVDVAAIVHDHQSRLKGIVTDWPVPGRCEPEEEADGEKTIPVYRVPTIGRLLYAPVSPQFPLTLRRAIKTETPDILHLHLPNTSAFWVDFLPGARRIPWVVHWHADVVSSNYDQRLKVAYPLYRPFEQRLLRKAEAVIVTSPTYLLESEALKPWRHKCRVVPLGINRSRIPDISEAARKEAEWYWPDDGFRILSVGRLTYYKGHEYLVRAAAEVSEARVLIVGEGERRRTLEKIICGLGLQDKVILTGKLDTETLHALMMSCDCFCLPSMERTEAFGMVLVEVMAHAKPSIVCDIPGSGVSWVVQDGKIGKVVPRANPKALAKALRSLVYDPETLFRMGHAAYQRYEAMFSIDRVGAEIRQAYDEVLNVTK